MSQASDLERAMQDMINQERTSRGLDPLTLELRLNDSAEEHSDWMLARDVFSHTGAGGSSAGDRMEEAGFDFAGNWSWGENIAWQSERGAPGLLDDVADLHQGLMNSPGHRANILSAGFDHIGIGIETGSYRGYDAVMVTQNFARTDGTVQLDQGTGPAPSPTNEAPEITTGQATLAPVKGGRVTKLAPLVEAVDPDGDTIQFFELRDDEGRDNLRIKGEGRVDASDGIVIAAEDLADLRLVHNRRAGETEVEIRAYDGTAWGDWAEIDLITLTADQWLAQA